MPDVSAVKLEADESGNLPENVNRRRPYRKLTKKEMAYEFLDENGGSVGWCVYSKAGTRDINLNFIGINEGYENQGYGSAIIRLLQRQFDYISIQPLAYETLGLSQSESHQRLTIFYIENGFFTKGEKCVGQRVYVA